MKIAIIGAGNMGGSIARGLAKGSLIDDSDIIVSNPSAGKLEKLKKEFPGISITNSNVEAATGADIVILAVKPWFMEPVMRELKLKSKQILISVAAGISFEELAQGAVYATLATLAMMLIYVGSRFEWRLGFGGIASLAHDVVITLGVFSALQVEMDLTFVAAILSVVGYSINDSIVVFDRVRENFRKIRRVETIDIIDISLTQTLSRTIMTSLTTLLVVIALFFFGGPSIHNFSLALLIGIGFGTYSSIFIAIAIAYDIGLRREHMIPPKVDKEVDDLP